MKRLILLPLALLIALIFFSQLWAFQILLGPQSGFLGPDSFYVLGNISVEQGQSLTILPPSVFIFNGNFEFQILGYLQAVGFQNDSIKFKPNSPTVPSWKGLHFQNSASDSSRIEYCSFTGANSSAVSCDYCSPTISHCTFIDNHTTTGNGGGIFCNYSNATIIYNSLINNSCPNVGAGIYCYYSNCAINYNTIINNSGGNGGGIFCDNSNLNISYCSIDSNSGVSGGGIFCENNSALILNECSISGNICYIYHGGGIYSANSNLTLDNCTINNNSSSFLGGGINFSNSVATLNNCTINNNNTGYWGGGIYCNNSSPNIFNCTIDDNSTGSNGGGICCTYNSDPIFNGCSISYNSENSSGGGIYCSNSNPTFIDCSISFNSTNGAGGAIYCENSNSININYSYVSYNTASSTGGGLRFVNSSNPVLTSCAIIGNTSTTNAGGGISCDNSNPNISGTVIHANVANGTFMSGGGIYLWNNSHPNITNCTITGNSAPTGTGGGIYGSENSSFNLVNSIIEGNTGYGGICIDGTNNSTLNYSDFSNNQYGNCTGYPPAGFGTITGFNFNGDPCDIFKNIFLAPQFVNPAGDNFNLQATSPCIDAGDPLYSPDPDFTFADMGAFYYYQSGISYISVSPTALGFGIDTLGCIDSLSIIIHSIGGGTLILRNIYTSDPVFTTNWNSNDSLLAVGDSLELKVYFTPLMATNYEDTLFIVNNSQLIDTLFVNIQGTGFAFPDVIITLTPINPPIIIPPGGGSFDYTVEIVNQEDSSTTFDAWINAIKPNGMIYGPIINRCLTLGGGVSLVRMMTQNVPASAPAGVYSYNGYVGDIESTTIWDSSSFNFTKSGFFENSGDNNWDLTGWEQEPLSMIETPTEFALLKPYPNPFNVDATLSFTIPKAGYVVLAVYDIQGREVTRMVDGWLQSGTYQETFSGMQLASGVYFAQLEANRFRQIQKLLLLR